MAKKTLTSSHKNFIAQDLASWNFIIFLTLAFMLIVAVIAAMQNFGAMDWRTKAAAKCPATVTSCDSGKAVCFRGADSCSRCVCSDK